MFFVWVLGWVYILSIVLYNWTSITLVSMKVQQIDRGKRGLVHFVYLPAKQLRKAGFVKGDVVEVCTVRSGLMIIRRKNYIETCNGVEADFGESDEGC